MRILKGSHVYNYTAMATPFLKFFSSDTQPNINLATSALAILPAAPATCNNQG